jgi:hypothetical protein
MRDFEDVRVILDCTENFVQSPSKLDAQKQVYSNYKHHNTFKFLVGVSPQMGIACVQNSIVYYHLCRERIFFDKILLSEYTPFKRSNKAYEA